MGRSFAQLFIILLILSACLLSWFGRMHFPDRLQLVQQRDKLVVLTRLGASTYYQSNEGPEGIEYDLAKRFANRLGVQLVITLTDDLGKLGVQLETGMADLVATGITATPLRSKRFAFATPYLQVYPQLIYRAGSRRPDGLANTVSGSLAVLADTRSEWLLSDRQVDIPQLHWAALTNATSEDLLYRVWSRQFDYAVVNSNEFTLSQHFYPELRVAGNIGKPQGVAWMFRRDGDTSLLEAANRFFADLRASGELNQLIEHYYGHLDKFDYVGTRVFIRHITDRLPLYRQAFQEAAEKHQLDWRLLAAIGYQESHWNPQAKSPTGVRGIMMLTRPTARAIGVDNRLDAGQSIFGGAAYLKRILSRIPERVPEPQRTWFALAAYNIGYGHLVDAQTITEMQAANPESWAAVRKRLPLLAQKKWYKRVKYGYARGWQPVRYVKNVRKYYRLLVRITEPAILDPKHIEAGKAMLEGRSPFYLEGAVQSLY
ncbi:membrane-bound lytic murein transglycosylase MltF [Nitrococcus mobilis]|uniref:Membrane-bound lytic murein transglycosylase F n=1 Tax=Nitrococcus mobilis Nb-231 TaxID=314278 RepID=A4BSR6_9GAMM|nr:membrane-bound lytic murein transglycosylase MltF [Nitrococcus mobilis]EAR21160.1 predicted soluble lytic transglycosylase fused to an ABC-type amino acid-binding protein [Nitrococcus mobilis Nb-231]